MSLIKKLQAAWYAKRLRSATRLPPAALGDLKDRLVSLGPFAIRATLESLGSNESREPALEVLERLISNETLPYFLEALASPDELTADSVTTLLARAQGYDPTRLLHLLSDPHVSKARLEAILSAQMKSIQPRTLITILPDLSKEARGSIFRLLEQGADSSIVSEAVRLAVHAEWWLRLHMAKLLSRFPSPEGIEAIIRLLRDENRAVRLEAAVCLGRLKEVTAIPALCRCLRDRDLKVQTAAIEALVTIGDVSAVPHLLEYLKDESEQVRRGAVEVLNEVVTSDAIKDLVSALRDEDWWVRVRAADALGSLGGERVVDAVIHLLTDEEDFIRRYAVEILITVPDQRAVEPLIQSLEDKDWWVRERSIDALAKTRDVRAVDPLIRLLSRDLKAAPLCARALSAFEDPRVVEPLCRLSGSENAEVRREAIDGLLEIVKYDFPEETRAQIESALDAAGVALQRAGSRPLEGRARRLGSSGLDPADPDRRPSSLTNWTGSAAVTAPNERGTADPVSPSPGAAPPARDFQNLPSGALLLDRYRVIRRIGGGGFGSVYLVEDVVVREELVLKILSPHLSGDESIIRRFVQELKFTRRITHRNVIRIYDLLNLNGAHAISMEYFPGEDLAHILKRDGRLSVERVLKIGMQLCNGLAAAHELGIVHRDIKPSNVLVGEEDVAKIVDFGLASVGQTTKSRLTQSGIMVGTPEYISPEQITGGDVDGRADLYSLGVMMYEMVSGQQAFCGENAVNVLFQHLEAEVPPLRQLAPEIPEAVEWVVRRAMAKEPADRPASALEMLAMIQAAA